MPPHMTISTVAATMVTATTASESRKHFRLADGRKEGMGNVPVLRQVGRKSCKDLFLIGSEKCNRKVHITTLPTGDNMKNIAWYRLN